MLQSGNLWKENQYLLDTQKSETGNLLEQRLLPIQQTHQMIEDMTSPVP